MAIYNSKGDELIPIATAERDNGLPKNTIRRDIHRNKLDDSEIQKVGEQWFISLKALEKYTKKEGRD